MIYLIWLILIALEVFRNWYLIVKKKHNIDHEIGSMIRFAVSFAFWMATPVFFSIRTDQWWMMPLMMGLTFWFLFDLFLNIARGKSFDYLGDGSWLDRIQKNSIGEFPSFCFKAILAVGSIVAFQAGVRGIFGI